MFVDDAYIIHATDKTDNTSSQLQQIVQNDLNEWNAGLESTGGRLNGSKTTYMILQWLFKDDGMPYLNTKVSQNAIVKLTSMNTTESIKQIAPDKDLKQFKSLGV